MSRDKQSWAFDECGIRDDVKLNFPADRKLRVFKIKSGDSGQTYFVQVWKIDPAHSTLAVICNCHHGLFLAPLSVMGLARCKHAENLLATLKSGG